MIQRSGRFGATVLTQEAPMELIRAFGFQSSKDVDKFTGYKTAQDQAGVDYVTQFAAARFSCVVEQTLDLGSHMLFIGRLEEAETLDSAQVMTYSYYHQVKKGSTPKNAPSYQKETKKKGFRCTVCGYIAEMDELPPDYICPVCGAPASAFEPIGE
jgi:flavin reductase (DIM6/NTAB) family NADH-FMN oxidoreductase RutF